MKTPFAWNRTWGKLALIGVLMYVAIAIITTLSGKNAVDEEAPSVTIMHKQALQAAEQFVAGTFPDYTLAARYPIVYQSMKSASGYLKKHELMPHYVQTYGSTMPLDFWVVEFSKTNSTQLLHVQVHMENGSIVGWKLINKKDTAPLNDSISNRQMITAFLQERGLEPAHFDLHFLDQVREQVNIIATSKATIADEARLHLQMYAEDGAIQTFRPLLEIPEHYMSWEKRNHDAASLMSIVSLILTVVFGIVALVYTIIHRKTISFRRGIVLALSFAAIYIVFTLGSAPAVKASLGGVSTPLIEWINNIISIGYVLFLSISLYFCLLSGERWWRASENWLCWPRWRDAHFGEEIWFAMGKGYLICLFILGVQQVLFFVAGEAFSAYAINDPSQSLYNMLWPGLFPLLAWAAGISEEILYRMFGVILFKRLLRSTFLAVLIPSIIWAFGHTGYAIYPSYTRLFEVAILGLIFGYVFLKHGLYTAIFAHVALDSLLMGLSLAFQYSHSAGYILLGMFYIVMPALVAYVILKLHQWLVQRNIIRRQQQ